MDLQNVQEQLNTEFSKADVRIIFWFDDKEIMQRKYQKYN